jgi:hypothetical protein
MTLPRTAADVLSEHVVFGVESIDRIYLNVYVPELQRVGQVVGFLTRHRGFEIVSTALVAPMSKDFVAGIGRYAADHNVPVIDFVKGQRKDDVMHEYLARSDGSEGVLFIGRAQEKARIFRTERRRNPTTGVVYPWIVTAMVNHFYFYGVDDDFGPFFLKFCSYFRYAARLCINGNECAKRQAAKAGIGHTALDNGFAAIDDVAGVQAICDGLTEEFIDALLRKWLARLPHPFTPADHAAGYRYEVSILQAEFSLTQMPDKPVSGRIFFEQAIRDNLDIGRPDQVGLIFSRQARRIFRWSPTYR